MLPLAPHTALSGQSYDSEARHRVPWSLEAVRESGPHSSMCASGLISSEANSPQKLASSQWTLAGCVPPSIVPRGGSHGKPRTEHAVEAWAVLEPLALKTSS